MTTVKDFKEKLNYYILNTKIYNSKLKIIINELLDLLNNKDNISNNKTNSLELKNITTEFINNPNIFLRYSECNKILIIKNLKELLFLLNKLTPKPPTEDKIKNTLRLLS